MSANGAFAAGQLPTRGFVVYQDLRSHAIVEVRSATGKLLSREVHVGVTGEFSNECGDPRHTFFGARWPRFEAYLVNVSGTPAYLDRNAVLADIVAGHDAWRAPFLTACAQPTGASVYRPLYGGTTARHASLADGFSTDDANVVEFRSLEGTVCDVPGVVACTVVDIRRARIIEADLLFESNLVRSTSYADTWTTDDTTALDPVDKTYEFAVSDVATHEWGHFAGLNHVMFSPALTMFPAIHDGMQTLGLGDMKGLIARYE